MTKPDSSALPGGFKAMVQSIREKPNRYRRRLRYLGACLLLVLGLGLSGLALLLGRRPSGIDPDMIQGYSLEGGRLLRELYMPGPAVGETPFPLAFEPDPGYTDGGALRLHSDLSGIELDTLEARRKAALEAVYDALD